MEVSKVKLTAETRAKLQNPTLDRSRKQELRRLLVIDYIKTKGSGSAFTSSELNKIAFPPEHKNYNVLRFIKAMERDGLITIEPIPNSYKYTLAVKNDRTKKAKQTRFKPLWTPDRAPNREGGEQRSDNLEQLAKEFAWETNSDSLREFIKWAKVKTLDGLTKAKVVESYHD